jgi:hypothetical protein
MPIVSCTDPDALILSPYAHIFPLPSGGAFIFTLPMPHKILDELASTDVMALYRYLKEHLRSGKALPESSPHLQYIIDSIYSRIYALDDFQYKLWIWGFGHPVYDECDRLAEFFIDEESLTREHSQTNNSFWGPIVGLLIDEVEKSWIETGHVDLHKAGIIERVRSMSIKDLETTERSTNTAHTPKRWKNSSEDHKNVWDAQPLLCHDHPGTHRNTYCGGSFKDVEEHIDNLETLTDFEFELLCDGALRIVDQPRQNWQLVDASNTRAPVFMEQACAEACAESKISEEDWSDDKTYTESEGCDWGSTSEVKATAQCPDRCLNPSQPVHLALTVHTRSRGMGPCSTTMLSGSSIRPT